VILSDTAIKNRTTVFVLILLVVFLGAFSYATLVREAFPDVKIPIVMISTSDEGVSPEDMESLVTDEIEKELTALKGLKEIRSASAEGMSVITLEFQPDVDIDDALQRVRDKVDLAKGELPPEAEDPVTKEISVSEFPIMLVSISGRISQVALKAIADELEDAIEQLPGVLDVDVLGALEREIRLELDQDRVAAYGLTIDEVVRLIPSENVNISAGGLETPGVKFNVRVPAEFVKAEEVDHLLLTVRDGNPIYLTDVATIKDTFKDRTTYSRLDGANSITLNIQKRLGADTIVIADAVNHILDEARRRVPAGTKIEVTSDISRYIRMMVKDLENNIISGLVLVVAVLVLFMGLRSSTIVALAIPLSMLISFAAIQALGYSLNMIVLFSLILALGMLVDNAIVIVENIYRHVELGHGRIEAAMMGTREVAWPVITSTATTVAAFSPLLFWPGIVGDFMKYLPITLIITLSSSLFVALVVSPTICSIFAGGRGVAARRRGDGRFMRGYRRLLATALTHRFVTLALAVSLLVCLGMLYRKRALGVEFFPKMDPKHAIVNIRAPQGTNINETDRLAGVIEHRVESHREHLENVVTNVGSAGGTIFGGSTGGPHTANVWLIFRDFEDRRKPSDQIVAQLHEQLGGIAGAEIKIEKEEKGPPTGEAINVRIIGKDFKELRKLSEKAWKMIVDEPIPGLVNLRSDLEAARPELIFRVDRRRAGLLGVNTLTIGNFLKMAVFGRKVSDFREYNDQYDITVRLPLHQRERIDDLLRLRVPNAAGKAVPLSSLGRFEYAPGFGTIHHVDRKRVVTLTASAEGRLDSEVLADVQARLARLKLPAGYSIKYAGKKEEQDKAAEFLFTKALPVALLVIVMILVMQFNTLSAPLIIMTTVGLSFIGVLVGLLSFNMSFGVIMTGIGVISLAGVVVNNAIVLLDYTRKLQARGMDLLAAAVQAGATRLRPVLLTAATTILGLLPMVTGLSYDFHVFEWATRSESSQWWRSMAVTVIFGLAFATLLTLVVVPTLYVTLYRLAAHFGLGGLKKAGNGQAGETAPGS